MVIVAGYTDVAPESRDAFLAERVEAIATTLREHGCLDYAFAADSVDPGRVRIFERWETDADLDAHLAARALAARPASAIEVRGRELLRYEISEVGPVRR